MYDLIGDIHGHADELRALLAYLGYRSSGAADSLRHPQGRRVIFLGDYVDRGPKIRETLQLVRRMVDEGTALAILGNHEYNALAFWQQNPSGGYLRDHRPLHILQHIRTIEAFRTPALFREWEEYRTWLLTLPVLLELPGLRAVHACWDPRHIANLRQMLPDLRLTPDFLHRASQSGTAEAEAIEVTLKGRELALPGGLSFADKDGHHRHISRVRWWQNPATATTYRDYFLEDLPELRDQTVDYASLDPTYYQDPTPVFFGHYWLQGEPQILQSNAVCLDYSVAKGGKLIGYRWDGEQELRADKLVWVA